MAAWLHTYKPYCGFQEVKVRPDAAVWNALIAAAGRAGQLQRAFEALQDMQVQPRLCSGSYILCHELCILGLFLCILLASSTKHALSLSAAPQYGEIVFECSSAIRQDCHVLMHVQSSPYHSWYTETNKSRGVYAFQQSQWEPLEAAAQSPGHRP